MIQPKHGTVEGAAWDWFHSKFDGFGVTTTRIMQIMANHFPDIVPTPGEGVWRETYEKVLAAVQQLFEEQRKAREEVDRRYRTLSASKVAA